MHTSKKILIPFLLLFASIAIIGCDSNDEDETSDAERFLGAWQIISAADQDGQRDQTAIFATLGTFTLTLNEDQTYTLLLDYTDPGVPDLPIPGTYSVNEASDKLILNIQLEGFPAVALTLDYVFQSDTQVEFTTDATILATLLGGAPLEGNVVMVVQKV